MTSPSGSEPRTRSLYHALSPVQAANVALVAVATLVAIQLVASLLGATAIAGATVAYSIVAIGFLVYARGQLALVGLRRTHARFLLAGLLIGLAAWYLELRIVEWLQVPQGRSTQRVERTLAELTLPASFVVMAALPALTEELVFRGVLARGFATRLPTAVAIVMSAVLFSAFHLVPRHMIGVFPLGLALGFLAIRADSIWPTMLAHFTNNAIVIVATRGGLGALDDAPPAALLELALMMVSAGIALAAKGTA